MSAYLFIACLHSHTFAFVSTGMVKGFPGEVLRIPDFQIVQFKY
jgi:hypothetical protein